MTEQSLDTKKAPEEPPPPAPSLTKAGPDPEQPSLRRGNRNTAVLLAFTAVTNLADGVTKIALPLLATQASASPAQVSAVSLTLTLPWLLAALHVGVLVDRLDRRRLLWGANALRLIALGSLMPLAASDGITIPVLCAVGITLGVAEVIALTSASAMIPALTPPEGREKANTWIAGAETVCNEFAGPFVGGLLLAAGTGIALGVTWVSYLAASLIIVLLVGRFRAARDEAAKDAAPATVRTQIAEGLRYLWQHVLLRTMALILTVLCACWGAWLALMPLFATTVMNLDSRQYGILLSALGIGGLAGALSVTWLNRFFGRRWVMFADLVGTFAMMAVPALTTELWVVAVAAFLGGMGGTLWTVNARTMAQRIVPDAMLGRYGAVSRLFSWGAMPVGAGLMGLIAEWFGMETAFGVFAVSVVLTIPPFFKVLTGAALTEAFGDTVRT